VRVDRPDPADESGDGGMAGNARPPDEPDATGKGLEREAGSEGLPGSSPALPGAAVRSERTLDYRSRVDAVYRQYDMDHGHIAPKEPERETAIFAMRRSEAEDRHRHPPGPGSRTTGMARLAEAADGSAPGARGGSGPGGHGGTKRDPVLPDDGCREFRKTTAGDAALVHDDDPYCPVSELKGDEPPTAEPLMKSPEFTGKNLRGFKDTDNPDYIDDYKRTYDAVAGPTAWASPRPNMARMISQIQRHIYEKDGIDFTVLDLTGASGAQIDEVFQSLDKWASNPEMHPKSRLIILGGGY
jgi:hypothetical protein